uniref:Endoribonuclease YBEY, chloroplastic isoform X2 n=1 Tax=Elaeis guineensis var. tenera TaxID=51953 RepID=A0A6I9QXN9_ELAGV|nr:endoribonuclease YBEY, chloroplastic isoform X2 [Elaeis guineensis]
MRSRYSAGTFRLRILVNTPFLRPNQVPYRPLSSLLGPNRPPSSYFPAISSLESVSMARIVGRALPLPTRSPVRPPHSPAPIAAALQWWPRGVPTASSHLSNSVLCSPFYSDSQRRGFHVSSRYSRSPALFGGFFGSLRGFRKTRRRLAAKKQALKEKQLELDVKISIEDELPNDPEVLSIAEMLKLNIPMAMKIAFDGLKDSEYKTRESSIDDVGKFEKVELSVLFCNDDFIRKLNKDWRGEDCATDVLSMSQHMPELDLPILMLGDIVISVETAARQAGERGHTLLDEIRILMVHGLLHLLGFDHEINGEAEAEMQKEEELVLKSLGWKGKGLVKSAYDAVIDGILHAESSDGEVMKGLKKAGSLRFYRPKFSYIFCDMDGTLLNSRSQITPMTAEAIRKAISRGVNIVIATGKGLLVYGRQGREICRRNLDQNVCREACLFSLKHEVPLIAFCQDRCFTLFEHPLVDSLHTIYHEPKAEVMPSVEHLLAAAEVQKLIFLDTAEGVSSTLRPHWTKATKGRAGIVQAMPDMLEIVPHGTSKGNGVKMLLDHLGVTAKEVMAIGDGENDVEMLQIASLGVALANGSEKAKAVANVIGATNDEDGAAKAIYQYAF